MGKPILKKRGGCAMSKINLVLKIVAIACFTLLLWVECASATTLVVNQTSPDYTLGDEYFTLIQAAVDRAKEGDEIVVCPGTYKENIVVDKLVSIYSYAGATDTTVEAYNTSKDVFHVTANYVTISGFTIKGGTSGIFLDEVTYCNILNNTVIESDIYYMVIWLKRSHNNSIKNNMIKSKGGGIGFIASKSNSIAENIISNNNGDAIWMNSSSNNVIRNNLITSNDNHGAYLKNCYNNIIEENIISDNEGDGVYLDNGLDNSIRNNTINSNYVGISVSSSNNNTVEKNIVSENTELGINLRESDNNIIKNNNINSNDGSGIELTHSSNNIIEKNTASDNRNGIKLNWDSSNNIIKNNVFKSNIKGIWLWVSSNNNTIKKNRVLDNYYGMDLESGSSNNIVKNNIVNSNSEYGILLIANSNDNILDGNMAFDNDNGINLIDSHYNIVRSNIIKLNVEKGVSLLSSKYNLIEKNNISLNRYEGISLAHRLGNSEENSIGNQVYHNNIVANHILSGLLQFPQVKDDDGFAGRNNWFDAVLEEGNYWSDYKGADDGSGTYKHAIRGDGIGDIPHLDYDYFPYMNKSGWLTFLASPEYWDFGTVYQGDFKPQKTFTIQNRGKNNLTILSITADKDVEVTGIKIPTNIAAGTSKSFNVTIDTKNLEGDILKTLEIVSNDKITPNKTILMYGFVKVYTPNVRIVKTEFESRVIQGQINLFQISVNNTGVANETNITVNFTDGDTVLSQEIQELKKNGTKTVTFKWNTSNVEAETYDITIEVTLKDKPLPLARLTVPVKVDMTSAAQTLIVTNKNRLAYYWGPERVEKLENELLKLSYHVSVAGIPVYVEEDEAVAGAYESWDLNLTRPQAANNIAVNIKDLIDEKLEEYTGIKYIIIVGDDRIIPFYRIQDNTDKLFGLESWYTEDDYKDTKGNFKLNENSTVGYALSKNKFLTDNFYATDEPLEWNTNDVNIPELFIPNIPVSRLVESPEQISAVIEAFYRKEYVRPESIFVTAYDFMGDTALHCNSTLKEKTNRTPITQVSKKYMVTVSFFENVSKYLLNIGNDILLIFLHADHDRFSVKCQTETGQKTNYITSQDISMAPADLNGSIIYSMSCHAGLNVPPNASTNDFDLVEAFAQKGVVAYIAPTGFGIGSSRIRAAHELLLSYFTDYLCDGKDAGTALTLAKQEYWATNYDFSYFDEQVLETTTLYGLPMAKMTIPPRNATSKNVSMMTVQSTHEEDPDTLVIRPLHVLNITPDGDYYETPREELLSCRNKPILPKEIRIFHPTRNRVLRGAVMTGAEYHVDEPFKPLIEEYRKSYYVVKSNYSVIKNWFPARIFKLNSISYPGRDAESRQYLIIIPGQYKDSILQSSLNLKNPKIISDVELEKELDTVNHLKKVNISERLKNMLINKCIPLSKNAILVKRSDTQWTIADKDKKLIYGIQKIAGDLFISVEKSGAERLYDELSFDLYYASPEDNDIEPPSIENVSHNWTNNTITITVNAFDNESGIRRVLVTYTDINGTWEKWQSKDCKQVEGNLCTCSIATEEEIEYFVQAVDNAGNVAVKYTDV
jgi:parallel beta-helix repeat protein